MYSDVQYQAPMANQQYQAPMVNQQYQQYQAPVTNQQYQQNQVPITNQQYQAPVEYVPEKQPSDLSTSGENKKEDSDSVTTGFKVLSAKKPTVVPIFPTR